MRNGLLVLLTLVFAFNACRNDELIIESEDKEIEDKEIEDSSDYSDWTDATHSNSAELNYDVVFNQTEVLRFDIEISSEDWAEMQTDLDSYINYKSSDKPMFVPCTFKFNDTEWYHVGIRYKGNSSLTSPYSSGISKLSFKLDFDEFEDDYPTIDNQRFYGFKQLNLKNNFKDPSLMREKVASDLFRNFGLASSETAFCIVYVDNGTGPQYYGVYSLVEEVDDTVIKTQFNEGSGNLYKPSGSAATFASGTYNTSQYDLKTNEDLANYSDVEALYNTINSSDRTSDTEAWKTELEAVFNVDLFLKYLAANNTIQNWDTYGIANHNYYLYNNPDDNLLTWIPWDNNLAFQETGKKSDALSFSMSEVANNWPLIYNVIAQPEYEAIYEEYLQQFINEVFTPSELTSIYTSYYNLLKDYAYAEESGYTFIDSESEFDQAVEELIYHVQSRNDAVVSYLN